MTCPLGLLRLHHPTWRRGGGGTDQNPGTFVENWGENSQEWPKKMKCWFLVLLIFCFWSKHWASKFNHSFCYIDFTWFHWQVCIVMMILQRGLDVFNILVETGYTRSIWQCFFWNDKPWDFGQPMVIPSGETVGSESRNRFLPRLLHICQRLVWFLLISWGCLCRVSSCRACGLTRTPFCIYFRHARYIFDNEVPAQFQTTGPNHQLSIGWNLSYIDLFKRSPPNPNRLWSTIGWNTFY
jgi:hypothetical protein